MKQRVLTVLLAFCLMFTMLPLAVSADGEEPIYIREAELDRETDSWVSGFRSKSADEERILY